MTRQQALDLANGAVRILCCLRAEYDSRDDGWENITKAIETLHEIAEDIAERY
jgi:hypothetical protein